MRIWFLYLVLGLGSRTWFQDQVRGPGSISWFQDLVPAPGSRTGLQDQVLEPGSRDRSCPHRDFVVLVSCPPPSVLCPVQEHSPPFMPVLRPNMEASLALVVMATAVLLSLVVLAVTCLHCHKRPLGNDDVICMVT